MTRHLEVVRAGPLTTVQDAGRFGQRCSGVSPSGAADLGSMARANHMAGNPASAAVLEATLGHLVVRARDPLALVVTGADCPGVRMDTVIVMERGDTIALGAARAGARAYVAVTGGIAAVAVLGSRSTDTLSGLGPAPLRDGDILPVGDPLFGDPLFGDPLFGDRHAGDAPPTDLTAPVGEGLGPASLAMLRGPRDDRLPDQAWALIEQHTWTVSAESNRVAVRVTGAALPISTDHLPPEPLVRGAVQVPPDGHPIIFLADHPVTGGYPVIGVLTPAACDTLAQARPGGLLRLRVVS